VDTTPLSVNKGVHQTPLTLEKRGGSEPPLNEKGVDEGGDKGVDLDHQRGGQRGFPEPPTELPSYTELPKHPAAQTAAQGVPILPLPDWMPLPQWNEFLKFRHQSKKPMSQHAQEIAIKRLDQLRELGHDPTAVIEQSILNSWAGLFPVSGPATGSAGRTERNMRILGLTRTERNLKNFGLSMYTPRGRR